MTTREIKFRAWNSQISKMRYDVPLEITYNGSYCCGVSDGYNRFVGKNTFLMQYTGLKDKNGKEIYEGDILYYETNKNIEYDRGYKLVKFVDGCYSFGYNCDTEYFKFGEVAGNIYENPELLTTK